MQFLSSALQVSSLGTEIVWDFRSPILEDISQGFPLVYRVVDSLSHQIVCHNLRIQHHHDHIMMDTLKNRYCKLKSFFLICSPLSFIMWNRYSFLNISPIGISIAVQSESKASTQSLLQCIQHPIWSTFESSPSNILYTVYPSEDVVSIKYSRDDLTALDNLLSLLLWYRPFLICLAKNVYKYFLL